jgi:hypothetical protein
MAKKHPPGTVAVLSLEQARWSWFSHSLLALQQMLPPGSGIAWVMGLGICEALNQLIREMRGEWICLLADDHMFEPDMVLHLLDRQVDIVAPLCCLRRLPFYPSLFREEEDGYHGYTWDDLKGQSGLMPVDAMGGPGMVIRRDVIEKLSDPWYIHDTRYVVAPREDLYFCSRMRGLGFQPYCDLDVRIDHIFGASVSGYRDHTGAWGVRLWSGADIAILNV